MNENFINTWVPNSELGRVLSLQEPIAKRREREGTTFDTSHALAQAIMKGWKKHSPADSLVISPTFELMGRLPVNERYRQEPVQEYLMFLTDSLAGELPGFGEDTSKSEPLDSDTVLNGLNVVLNDVRSSQEVLNVFRAPGLGHQDYTVVEIDATTFENGGTLMIDISVGHAEAAGSFDLFDGASELPTEGAPQNALASVYGVQPGETQQITYTFNQGQHFKFGATGDWFSEKGSTNAFVAKISVEPSQKPEMREGASTRSYQSPEDLMNAFVKALKNVDPGAMRSILTGRGIEILGIEVSPEVSVMLTGRGIEIIGIEEVLEDVLPQLRQMFRQIEVLSSEYVGGEFHFRLKMPAMSPPEVSVKMRKVGDEWLIYDIGIK